MWRKTPYNGKNNNGEVVLAMIEMDDDSAELLDFGYSDDICDDNREEFACMTFVNDNKYNTDEEEKAQKTLLKNLFYDSARDESNKSESDESGSDESELESDESESDESKPDELELEESKSNGSKES